MARKYDWQDHTGDGITDHTSDQMEVRFYFQELLEGGFTLSGIIGGLRKAFLALVGSFTSSGIMSTLAVSTKALAGSVAFVGDLSFSRFLNGILTMAGVLVKKVSRKLEGSYTSTGTVQKKSFILKIGAMSSSGIQTTKSIFRRVLVAAMIFSGNLIRDKAGLWLSKVLNIRGAEKNKNTRTADVSYNIREVSND